jgi:hypothetical protein
MILWIIWSEGVPGLRPIVYVGERPKLWGTSKGKPYLRSTNDAGHVRSRRRVAHRATESGIELAVGRSCNEDPTPLLIKLGACVHRIVL